MEINISDIVRAMAGHDKGRTFVVVGKEGNMLLLADGKRRKIEKPKRKKVIHVRFEKKTCCVLSERIMDRQDLSNSEIRKILAVYNRDQEEIKGGMHLG